MARVPVATAWASGRDDVEIERFAGGTRFLGAVENADGLDGLGQFRQEVTGRERTIQAYGDDADLLTLARQIHDGLARHIDARTHQDDNTLGIRCTVIVERLVVPADQGTELVHRLFDDTRHRSIIAVRSFAALEAHVRVHGGTAHDRMVGIERAAAMGADQIVVDHRADVGFIDQRQRVDLVRGTEAVEEMHERNARFQRGRLGDQCHVVRFLHRVRSQHGEARGAGGHDVRMIAEDRQTVGGERTRRDMEDRRRQFAGDLEHVRDHQQQALGGRERRRDGACLQRAVYGTSGAAFRLHLLDRHGVAPDVLDTCGHPFVGQFRHGR